MQKKLKKLEFFFHFFRKIRIIIFKERKKVKEKKKRKKFLKKFIKEKKSHEMKSFFACYLIFINFIKNLFSLISLKFQQDKR